MKMNRLIASVLAVILAVFSPAAALAADYSDIESHWAREQIIRWSEMGIVQGGDGVFRPNAQITRGELAVLLDRIMQYSERAENSFIDLESDAWYTDAILKLNAAGVMLGGDAQVRPKANVTRQEAAVMIVRAFQIALPAIGKKPDYKDADDIATWAVGAVGELGNRGYMKGGDGVFRPKDGISRAEAVTLLDNIVKALARKEGEYNWGDVGGSALVSSDGVTLTDTVISGDLYIAKSVKEPVVLKNSRVSGSVISLGSAGTTEYKAEQQENKDGGASDSGADKTDSDTSGSVKYDPDKQILFRDNVLDILDVEKNEYSKEDFIKGSDGRIEYDAKNVKYGIDVSSWQGDIDWNKVAADGVDFAMIRVGYTGYSLGNINVDANFEKNIKGALDAGLKVGVYYFSQAVSAAEARKEARFVLDTIEGYNITYPVVFDWESINSASARTTGVSGDTLTLAADSFCSMIEGAGYRPMVYFYQEIGYLKYDLTALDSYDFWLAEYSDAPGFYYDFQMWQYTSKGKVDGIEGDVDMNICFKRYR